MNNQRAQERTIELIKTIIATEGVTRYAIAKTAGINQSAMQRYASGDSTPSLDTLMKLSEKYAHNPAVAAWFTDTFNLPNR